MEYKKCSKCGENKLLSEYYDAKSCKDGKRTDCKACLSAENKLKRETNQEEISKRRKERYNINKEKIAEQQRKHYAENKAMYAEKAKRYREENKEKIAEQRRIKYVENRKDPAFVEKQNERGRIYASHNKEQAAQRGKKYREENKEKIKQRQKIWKDANKDKVSAWNKRWNESNKEKRFEIRQEYNANNKEKIAEYSKKYKEENAERVAQWFKTWEENNKEKRKEYKKVYGQENRERYKERRKNDPQYRLASNLRGRLSMALRKNKIYKDASTMDLVGCTLTEVMQHLEQQFTEGMNWDNYGVDGWHVDHIVPCAMFDLTDIEQQKICFHYTNLQPLWAYDNISKGAKLIYGG